MALALASRARLSAGSRGFPMFHFAGFASQAKPKLVVFGGNGFLGREICKTATEAGFDVVAVSRTLPKGELLKKVTWIESDVFDYDVWAPKLQQEHKIDAAVSAVGGIRENQRNSFYYNFDANMAILEHTPEVKSFVYLSTQQFGNPLAEVIRGYYDGKRKFERRLMSKYPNSGTSLRLPLVSGEGRQWPISPALEFWKSLSSSLLPSWTPSWFPLLAPPLSKEEVAHAVVRTVQRNIEAKEPLVGSVERETLIELSRA